MKLRLSFLRCVLLIILTSVQAFSQKLPFKIGQVTIDELQLQQCDFYPEAEAMILGSFGNLDFQYSESNGWKYQLEISVRKKIFNINEAKQGDVNIRVYHPKDGSSKEVINNLKAFSYNLEDGKIKKEKLETGNIYTTRLNEYWEEITFAIPNITSGTVVEYSYTKSSDFLYNLSTWHFQKDIPVAYSEFRYSIPEYYQYQVSQVGTSIPAEINEKTVRKTITYTYYSGGDPKFAGARNKNTETINYTDYWKQLIIKNIPPVEDEPYISNRSDLPSRVQFQLISTRFPNSPINEVASNYNKFNSDLIQRESFGQRLKNGNFVKDKIIVSDVNDKIAIANSVYTHIANHFNWNEVYTFLSDQAGRPAYNKQEGNVADINLSLVAAFKEYGLNAYPIILSTRGHGTVHPIYPSFDEFNYVIACVEVNGKLYFADASARLPFGTLPTRCLNGQGWFVGETGGKWINLKSNAKYSETTQINIALEDDAILSTVTHRSDGYAKFNIINKLKRDGNEEFIKDLKSDFEESEIKNVQIPEYNVNEPVTIEYEIERPVEGTRVIYLQPVLTGSITDNPFKRETRMSTVDFPYGQSYKVFTTIEIPEGYKAELPSPARIALPDNEGSYSFTASQMGNKVTVVSMLDIKKTLFSPAEYTYLKEFYQLVSEKNKEFIVLSK